MKVLVRLCVVCLLAASWAWAAQPPLPEKSGTVTISVQDDPAKPARDLNVFVYYPNSRLAAVTPQTGLMLMLHNWGGKTFDGSPFSGAMVQDFNVVIIGVEYYQSGDKATDTLPYDFGYLQAMDALRALYYVYDSLTAAKIPFDATRIYGAGGSGGGNVIAMANKFAPHTFACIVDCSGMASLTDDIAYGLPGGSGLNARYSKDPASPNYLSKPMQEIRDQGNPAHLAVMKRLGDACKVVVLHGEDDGSCLVSDKKRVVDAMLAAGLTVEPHYFGAKDIDGKLVLNSGHSIGSRAALLVHFAGPYLTPATGLHLAGLTDFARKETIEYPVTGGRYRISYAEGCPTIKFVEGK